MVDVSSLLMVDVSSLLMVTAEMYGLNVLDS